MTGNLFVLLCFVSTRMHNDGVTFCRLFQFDLNFQRGNAESKLEHIYYFLLILQIQMATKPWDIPFQTTYIMVCIFVDFVGKMPLSITETGTHTHASCIYLKPTIIQKDSISIAVKIDYISRVNGNAKSYINGNKLELVVSIIPFPLIFSLHHIHVNIFFLKKIHPD